MPTGVTLADPTPAGLTFVSNAGNCTTAFPCDLGTVPSGATRTITATFAIPVRLYDAQSDRQHGNGVEC